MERRYIRLESKDGVAWITFNHPEKLNTLNPALLLDFRTNTRIVGLGSATEPIFLGEMIRGDQAQGIGLVNKVVPLEQLEIETEKLASQSIERPVLALRAVKMAIRKGLNVGLKD
jgi:enoyl-CoA hydratase/carnithine racemase